MSQLELAPGELSSNREHCLAAITEAAGKGADIVILPELASSGYRLEARARAWEASEPVPGPTTAAWQAACRQSHCWVVGGICERDGRKLYNTAVLVGPDGLVARYRKLHLFGTERDLFEPGDRGLPVAKLPFGNVGMLICYDLRFVESARILALRGADLIAVPTAWVGGFDPTPSTDGVIDQVRAAAVQANLDQAFIACASRVGADGDLLFLGSSCIVDPYGRFAFGPASRDRREIAVATIDIDQSRAARDRGPGIAPRDNRRDDVYGAELGYMEPVASVSGG